MRGIAFKGNSIAEVIDYPDIAPGPEQVLIKLRSSGLCGSDFMSYRDKSPNEHNGELRRPGHEPCGEIVELGPNVKGLSVGDRIIQHHLSLIHICRCRRIERCRSRWSPYH